MYSFVQKHACLYVSVINTSVEGRVIRFGEKLSIWPYFKQYFKAKFWAICGKWPNIEIYSSRMSH